MSSPESDAEGTANPTKKHVKPPGGSKPPESKPSGSKAPGDKKAAPEQKKLIEKCKNDDQPCIDYCVKLMKAPEKAPAWVTKHKFSSKTEKGMKVWCRDAKGGQGKCKRGRVVLACLFELQVNQQKARSAVFGKDESSNTGLIIAGAVGVIVLIAAAIAVYLFCFSGGKGKGTRGTASKRGKSGKKRSSIKSSKSKRSSKSKAGSKISKRSGRSSKSKKSKKSGKSKKSKK